MSGEPRGESPGSGFHRLMTRLDRDPARAAQEFERLRRALTKFFDWRAAPWPEDGADETIDRLAAKLDENVAVADIAGFALGIARLVLKEQSRADSRRTSLDAVELRAASQHEDPDESALQRYLEDCLGRFSHDERALVLSYYSGGDGRGKIESRRKLASGLGLSDNALRSRVQRLRDRLEQCIRSRLPGVEHTHGIR